MALSPSDRALGDVLVGRQIVTLPQLDEAKALAERWNVRLGDAILSRNWVRPADYYQGIAYHFGLPFIDLIAHPPDRRLLRAADADSYARRLTIPWGERESDGRLIIATAEPGPETVLFARRMWGNDIEFAVASKLDIIWSVQTAFADALSRRAVYELAEQDPTMSARTVVTPAQALILYGLLTLLLGGLAFAPVATLIALNVALSVFYLGNFLFRGVLVAAGGGRKLDWNYEVEIAARALLDDELPVFTVLVPMFREAAVLPKLAQSLRALDYPLGKLDIKIVLEEGDTDTLWAARQLGLEGVFEVIRVPPSQPQTKPKACNYALRFARGEYVVIYDAEDQPEPDQLRKVVATFRRCRRRSPACNAGSTTSTPTRTGSRACSRSTIRSGSTWCCRASSASTSRSRSAAPPTISRSMCCANCAAGTRSTSPRTPISASGCTRRATASPSSTRPPSRRRAATPATGSASARAGSRATCRRCWCTRATRCS